MRQIKLNRVGDGFTVCGELLRALGFADQALVVLQLGKCLCNLLVLEETARPLPVAFVADHKLQMWPGFIVI